MESPKPKYVLTTNYLAVFLVEVVVDVQVAEVVLAIVPVEVVVELVVELLEDAVWAVADSLDAVEEQMRLLLMLICLSQTNTC